MPPKDVPDQGHMAIFGDPAGAAIGVWQPREMKGYELVAEPGTPAWHELHTKDYEAAVKFYQEVFGWDTEVMSTPPCGRLHRAGRWPRRHRDRWPGGLSIRPARYAG